MLQIPLFAFGALAGFTLGLIVAAVVVVILISKTYSGVPEPENDVYDEHNYH